MFARNRQCGTLENLFAIFIIIVFIAVICKATSVPLKCQPGQQEITGWVNGRSVRLCGLASTSPAL